jgi:hypothetical protein
MSDGEKKSPMPKHPPVQLAKLIVDITTGEVENKKPNTSLSKHQAAELGGKKRATILSKRQRSEIASKAARARSATLTITTVAFDP